MKLTIAAGLCLIMLVGCSNTEDTTETFIESLADTVWAEEDLEVVLTTGTGCWYYADALGGTGRSLYGFYKIEKKLLNAWDVRSVSGHALRETPEYAVVHPEYCERHFKSGLVERIEAIPGKDALLLTFDTRKNENAFLRVYSAQSKTSIQETKPVETVATDSNAYAIVFDEDVKSSRGIFSETVEHPKSTRRGEPDKTNLSTGQEYSLPKSNRVACVIAFAPSEAEATKRGLELVKQIHSFKRSLRGRSEAALSRFTFRTEDQSIERAYAWARIMMAGMYYEQNGEARILTGLPESPYMSTFHSALASSGLLLSDQTRSRSMHLFETILGRKNDSLISSYTWRIPIDIYEHSATYTSSIGAGAVALAFDRVAALSDTVPLGLPTNIIKSLDRAVAGEIGGRFHVLGMISGQGLFSNIGFPPRERLGAAFETQALFSQARIYLATHYQNSSIKFAVPEAALRGAYEWRYPYLPPVAVGANEKQYPMPLLIEPMTRLFNSVGGIKADRLLIPGSNDTDSVTPEMIYATPQDTTQTVAPILALYWLEKENKQTAKKLLAIAESREFLTTRGLRSLSPTSDEYQFTHVYQYNSQPINAELSGDVLVWSSGILADLYATTGRHEEVIELFEQLSSSILDEGVIGGMPELENGDRSSGRNEVPRNPLFASSQAEYLRILYDDILGIDTKRQSYPGVNLRVPAAWGQIEFSFEVVGAVITLKRLDADLWSAWQTGSKETIQLEVELWPETDVRGYGAIKLNPEMIVKFKVIPTSVGHYTLAWDEFTRE